ncbi:MAG: hypothetical protein OQK09_00645 [Colwellia sp.]|nr:hypothetical protein [Colwellia sp.]MCW8866538.1 hypothetical protein [Colwellia sp.]MCW9079996.1 hypothetical protein [Colwellia sp.]
MPNSEKSLFQLKSFRYALWLPISIAFLISVYIILTSNLVYKTGFVGLNNLWDIFKVPLAVLSLAFPSVALVTANHRSIQSKRQIQLTASQNTLKNFYDSINDFERYLDSFAFQDCFIYTNKRVLYKKFFPENSPIHVETTIDKKTISNIKDFYQNNINNIMQEMSEAKYLDSKAMFITFPDQIIADLYKRLQGNWLVNFGIEVKNDAFGKSDSVIKSIAILNDEFYSLLGYCMEYSSENGLVICPHEVLFDMPSWKVFHEQVEKKFNFKLESIDFERLIPPEVKYKDFL